MLVARTFYRGFPPDGAASGGVGDPPERVTKVNVFKLNAQVPGWKRWRISSIRAINTSQVVAYYSVAFLHIGADNVQNPPQGDMGKLNGAALPKSIQTVPVAPSTLLPNAPTWNYVAYSEPVPPAAGVVKEPIGAWGASDEFLCVGAYPGAVDLLGYGAVHVEISGWEYRD